jgi:hypothetical protein
MARQQNGQTAKQLNSQTAKQLNSYTTTQLHSKHLLRKRNSPMRQESLQDICNSVREQIKNGDVLNRIIRRFTRLYRFRTDTEKSTSHDVRSGYYTT